MIFCVAFVIIGGVVTLSFYNTASVVDDYCFSCTAKTYGFWESQKMYYLGWSGRYFSTFYYASNPLVLSDSRIPFIIFPILLLLSFLASFIFLFITLFKGQLKKATSITLGLSIAMLFFVNLPKVSEALFWYSGTYTFVSIILTLLFFICWYVTKTKPAPKKGVYVILIILFIAILGSSEISMTILSGLVFLDVIWQYINTKKISKLSYFLIVLSISCSLIVSTAPGNFVRLSEKTNFIDVLLRTFSISSNYMWQWISTPSFFLASIAYLWFIMRSKIKPLRIEFPLLFTVPALILIVFLSFFPSTYGLGPTIETPGRILNLNYFIFFISWFYNLTMIANKLKMNIKVHPFIQLVGLSIILLTVGWSQNVKYIYRDIRFGTANEHLIENQARLQLLKQDASIVFLEPIKAKPYNLFVGDINENYEYLWNKCLADYYGKEKVIIIPNID